MIARNTPFIVPLFFLYFGLPAASVKLSPEVASIIAMVVNLSAMQPRSSAPTSTPIRRARSKPRRALALDRMQTFTRVILPPVLKKVWPSLVSQIIIVMLGSAVCRQISTQELSYAANLFQSRNFRAFEAYIIATSMYLSLAIGVRAAELDRAAVLLRSLTC